MPKSIPTTAILILAAVFATASFAADAKEPEALTKERVRYDAELDTATKKIQADHVARLKVIQKNLMGAGDLDGALAVRDEIKGVGEGKGEAKGDASLTLADELAKAKEPIKLKRIDGLFITISNDGTAKCSNNDTGKWESQADGSVKFSWASGWVCIFAKKKDDAGNPAVGLYSETALGPHGERTASTWSLVEAGLDLHDPKTVKKLIVGKWNHYDGDGHLFRIKLFAENGTITDRAPPGVPGNWPDGFAHWSISSDGAIVVKTNDGGRSTFVLTSATTTTWNGHKMEKIMPPAKTNDKPIFGK